MRLLHDTLFLSQTLEGIYDCVLDPSRWQVIIPQLGELIGARRTTLTVGNAGGSFEKIAVMNGYPSLARVVEYAPINPIIPLAMVHPPDKPFIASRELGVPALKGSRFYREFLQPLGDLDAIGFIVTREGQSFGNWLLVTQEDRGPITDEEAAGLALVAPHLRRAVEISSVLGAQRMRAEAFGTALGQLDSPVLILDGRRRVTYANPRAEAVLAAGTVLRPWQGGLRGATETAEAALRRVAEQSLAGGASGFEAAITGTDGEECLLFTVAFEAGDDGGGLRKHRWIMLMLRAPREDTRNPIAIAARLFKLTAAQIQVLGFLAQGHSPDAIADILGTSITTVRTHLSDMFGKTGTSRQAELVARALSLASPLRPTAAGGK